MRKIVLSILLTFFAVLQLQAQVVIDEQNIEDDKDELSDSALLDTTALDSVVLPWPQSVQAKLDRLMQSSILETSQVGLMVWDLTADSCIYRRNERQTMRPASTMKIITAITALDRLGGSYQFKTHLKYTGKIVDGVLDGDLYCVGGMDPRFNADDMAAFVNALHEAQVDTIRGRIYADKSMKDADRYGEGWCWDDDNPSLSPLLISRKDNFLDRFFERLRQDSIYFRSYGSEWRAPQDAKTICTRSHSIDQVLSRMLKESDNLYAESMFYQIAALTGNRPASAKSARWEIRKLIGRIGLDPARYKIADGSGLSLYNYVTAELETKMLRYAYKNRNIYAHLYPALPIAGEDGTLKKRMQGSFTRGNVHAKTGTVTCVITLAGYCTAANGHHLCFSILNNGILHGKNARAFQDQVCNILCRPE